jgi:large subunit ribosomal protein L17
VRIIRTGYRPGDNAETAMIELVDFNTIYTNGTAAATEAAPMKRTRRCSVKKAEGAEGAEGAEAPKARAPRKKAEPKAEGEEKPKATRKKKSEE